MIKKFCEMCGNSYNCENRKVMRSRTCGLSCRGKLGNIEAQYVRSKRTEVEWINDLRRRFEKFTDKGKNCWNWKGASRWSSKAKKKLKYGIISFKGNNVGAHRASYMIYKGDIPKGMIVLHNCDEPACVNPDHLKIGTYLDNQYDKRRRKRCVVEKLTEKQVREIKILIIKGINGAEIGRKYGVSRTTIANIRNNKQWKWVT